MRTTDLQEARRNPALNNRNRTSDGINRLLDWSGKGETYATFTDLAKVGVNPQSKYDTPIGVYCYPLFDGDIVEQIENDSLPHAGQAAFISVMRAKGEMVDLQGEAGSFEKLNLETASWLATRIKLYNGADEQLPPSRVLSLIWEKVYTYAAENAASQTPGGIFWAFTRWCVLLERYINEEYKKGHDGENTMFGPADLALLCHTVHSLAKGMKGAPAKWTRLFLDIGVQGAVDIDGGIIHSNEPTQAVFFNPTAIEVVDRIPNPRKKTDKIVVKTAQDFLKMLISINHIDTSITVRMLQYIQDRPEGDSIWNVSGTHQHTKKNETWKVYLEPTGPIDPYFDVTAAAIKRRNRPELTSGMTRATMYVIGRLVHSGDRHLPLWVNFLKLFSNKQEVEFQLRDGGQLGTMILPPEQLKDIKAAFGIEDQPSTT